MTAKLVTIDGISRPLAHWAQSQGMGKDTLYDRIRRGWDIKAAIFTPLQPRSVRPKYTEPHDTETDALCESGEPDRRVIVYGMVCCGATDEAIVDRTGFDAAEVAKFRVDCPEWWGRHMGHAWEFVTPDMGVGR